MTEAKPQIQGFVDQWASYLCARYYLASDIPIDQLTPRVKQIAIEIKDSELRKCYETGLTILKDTSETDLLVYNKAIETAIKQFATNKLFPRIFRVMMAYAHSIVTTPLIQKTDQKVKALHSDAILNDEMLGPFELLSCEVFIYLSTILQIAASTPSVNLDDCDKSIIEILYIFMNHSQPNAVRASAGDIMSALSTSATMCLEITDQFWKKFSKCKKDDDFRNFASWIDGVEKLHFSLMTPQLAECSIHFFQAFITSSKKIERGVLRMKFLDAIYAIIARLSKESPSATHAEYNKCLSDVWSVALKWSSKAKHTAFCYKFLQKVLAVSSSRFFNDAHGLQFIEIAVKYARNGDPDMLKMISSYIAACPIDFYRNRSDEFARAMNTHVLQLLFPGFEKKPALKFSEPAKQPLITSILVEIGRKHIGVLVDFFKCIFQVPKPNDDIKTARVTTLQAIATLCDSAPEIIRPHNDSLFPLIEPILLSSAPGFPEEMDVAMHTFPLIRSPNATKLAQISQVLYDAAIAGNHPQAISALCRFVEKLVTVTENPLPPVIYLGKLLDRLPLMPKNDVMTRLRYIKGLATAFANAMSACSDEYGAVTKNQSALTASEWTNLRFKIDKLLVPLMLSPDTEIVTAVNEVQDAIDKLADFDTAVVPAPAFFLSRLSKVPGDITSKIPKIIEGSGELAFTLFESTFEYWTANVSRIDEKMSAKVITFLASLARGESPATINFFDEFNKLLSDHNPAAIHALSVIDPSMWPCFVTELNHWMTPSGHSLQGFWSEYTQVHFTFASSPKFMNELREQTKLQDTYERFLISFWRTHYQNSDLQAVERCFKIMQNYVACCEVEKIIDNPSEFIQTMETIANTLEKDVQVETFLRSMQTVCQYLVIPEDTNFFQWLCSFMQKFSANDQVSIQSTQLLTIILSKQPQFLTVYLKQSLDVPSPFVLAVANTYAAAKINDEKSPTLLAVVFAHLYSTSHDARQAAVKLMCLLLTNSLGIFLQAVDASLMTALSAKTPFGYLEQNSHFAEFAASAVKPAIALQMLAVFASEIDRKVSCLSALVGFISPALTAATKPDELAMILVHITAHCNPSDPADSRRVLDAWAAFWSAVKAQKPDAAPDVLQALFDQAVDTEKNELISAILAIASAMTEFGSDTVATLMKVVCMYERSLPTDLTTLVSFLESADLKFEEDNKSEVVAYNCLSQVLQVLESREDYEAYFSEKLSVLVFFAVMNHHVDSFHIGSFQPLLDTLLEAVLFRFGMAKPGGLKRLQDANLLRRAPSLEAEDRVLMESPHAFLTYDTNAVRALVDELAAVKEGFKEKFFDELLAVCLQTDCSSKRVSDPLTMLAALASEMDPRHVYYLLLYSLHAFRKNSTDALDALIDSIHARMMSGVMKIETLPVLIVFILYLSLELKASNHIMKLISDMCDKICTDGDGVEMSSGLIAFFTKFNGDEYITSIFLKFILNATSANDPIVLTAIKCLMSLARFMGLSSGSDDNMCMLLAVLADGFKTYIGQRTSVDLKPMSTAAAGALPEFVNSLIIRFPGDNMQRFMLKFFCAVMKQIKWNDTARDIIAMQMMREYVRITEGETKLEPHELESVVKSITLISLTTEEPGRTAGLETISELMLKNGDSVYKDSYGLTTIRPKFIEVTNRTIGRYQQVTKMVVDPALLPEFSFFPFSGMETKDLVDLLWNLISSKIEAETH